MNTAQPQYERKVQIVKKEKNELAVELEKARHDIACLKSVQNKDIQLLESELDKTYKAKVEMEVEFKENKRQLHNALRNLEDMAQDGGKMRCDLEGVVHDFTQEKKHYQKEIDHLKKLKEEQMSKIDKLERENEQYEDSCKELRKSVERLEDRLMKEMRNKKHNEEESGDRDVLLLEIQYLKSKLEKAEENATSYSADAVAVASAAAEAASTNQAEISQHEANITQLQSEKLQLSTQIAHHAESMEQLRLNQRETSKELSRAQQTNQILKSKERYLESRVESLANQISKTVQDYEMRLSSSASVESGSIRLMSSASGESSVCSSKWGSKIGNMKLSSSASGETSVGSSSIRGAKIGSGIPRSVGGGSSRFGAGKR